MSRSTRSGRCNLRATQTAEIEMAAEGLAEHARVARKYGQNVTPNWLARQFELGAAALRLIAEWRSTDSEMVACDDEGIAEYTAMQEGWLEKYRRDAQILHRLLDDLSGSNHRSGIVTVGPEEAWSGIEEVCAVCAGPIDEPDPPRQGRLDGGVDVYHVACWNKAVVKRLP